MDTTFQPETMNVTINRNDNSWLATSSDGFKTPIEEPRGSKRTKKKIKLASINCLKCTDLIKEKHLYAIGDKYWHKGCVRCDICNLQLEDSAFLIDNTLLCRICYNQSVHVTKCCGCKLPMQTHEVAMYIFKRPYHLACFRCNYCKNLLSKGDKFMFQNDFLICKQDFESGAHCNSQPPSHLIKQTALNNNSNTNNNKSDNPIENNGIRKKTKISSSQRQYLEDYYVKNSSPSVKQKAYIAEELNLTTKVVQTWFGNYRTKMKMQRNNELKLLSDKLHHSEGGGDYGNNKGVRKIIEQEYDQDGPNNCQISQSTEDHCSPQDLSSDLSGGAGGLYTCPDIMGTTQHNFRQRRHFRDNNSNNGGDGRHEGNDGDDTIVHATESTDERGLTFADISNSCVKSIDRRSLLAGFGGGDISLERVGSQSTKSACLTWS